MIAVIQNVLSATLRVDGEVVSKINNGALVFVGINQNDTMDDVKKIALKLSKIRMFPDSEGKINLNITNANKEYMLVSNFTLNAITNQNNRPGFTNAAKFEVANELYSSVCNELEKLIQMPVKKGVFGGDMKIDTELDGPINIIIDSTEL